MNKKGCETYELEILPLLEGVLPPADASAVRGHLDVCPPCASLCHDFALLEERLFDLGADACRQVPQVALVDGVMAALGGIDQEQALAYLDEEMTESERAAFAKSLLQHPELRQNVQDLREMDALLRDWSAGTASSLDIDIVDGVMAAVRAEEAPADEFTFRRDVKRLEDILFEMGEAWQARVPRVELTAEIMAALPAAAPRIAPMKTRPKGDVQLRPPKRSYFGVAASLAAAAALLVTGAFVLWQTWNGSAPGTPDPGDRVSVAEHIDTDPIVRGMYKSFPPITSKGHEQSAPKTTRPEARAPRERYEGASLKSVLNARRKAMVKDAEALASLANWATLSPEEAKALLASLPWTSDAVLGATQFLSPEDAVAVLEAAVKEHPEDAYLRAALAKNYDALERLDEGRAQAEAWGDLDPNNSLPHYLQAELLFQQGYPEEALAELRLANAMPGAELYPSESARNLQQALVSNGLDSDIATLLAATTAGTTEYADVLSLSQELLAYGKEYEALGDYETAQQIYAAVQQMGMQVDQNAEYANVRLAGTDVQMDAVSYIMNLYSLIGTPEAQYVLQSAYDGLLTSLTGITNIFTQYTTLFATLTEQELVNLADQIINTGDSGVLSGN